MTKRTETIFYSTGEFTLTLATQPVAAVPDSIHIQITSRWGHAKNPQDDHRLLGLTLSRGELASLIKGLQEAIHVESDHCQ